MNVLKQIIEGLFKHTKQYELKSSPKKSTLGILRKDSDTDIKKETMAILLKDDKPYITKDKTAKKIRSDTLRDNNTIRKEENLVLEKQLLKERDTELRKNPLENIVNSEEVRFKAVEEQENIVKKELDRVNATYSPDVLSPHGHEAEDINSAYNKDHNHSHETSHYQSNHQKNVYQ